jgi:hypothetical protein
MSVAAAGDVLYVVSSGSTDSTVRAYPVDGCGQATCEPIAAVGVTEG